MNSQLNKILKLLERGDWVCTSQMYALYMSDPRRRLCDLKEKGYILESKKCSLHDFHRGGSKMWRLIGENALNSEFEGEKVEYSTPLPQNPNFKGNFAKSPIQTRLLEVYSFPNH